MFGKALKVDLFFKYLVWVKVLTSFWVNILIFESVEAKRVRFYSEITEKLYELIFTLYDIFHSLI